MISVERFRLPFLLPAFNELEAASRRRTGAGGRSNAYADLKRELQPAIVGYILKAKLRPLLPGVSLLFTWWERDRRRDPLDVRPACKLILDALSACDRPGDRQAMRAGIIHCDGWHCVAGVSDVFRVDAERPGVEVAVYGVRS